MISNFGILYSSGGRKPDKLLLSRRLQKQRCIFWARYKAGPLRTIKTREKF